MAPCLCKFPQRSLNLKALGYPRYCLNWRAGEQARHATYGAIEAVSGRLVPADPLIAHQDLNNAAEVSGSVVYVKVRDMKSRDHTLQYRDAGRLSTSS